MRKLNSNKLLRGIKIEIYPTEDQKSIIENYFNLYRGVYNLGLEIQRDNFQNGIKYTSLYDFYKLFSEMRNNNDDYKWLKNLPLSIIREALRDLDDSFKYFLSGEKRYPRFKSKKKSKKSFGERSSKNACYIEGKYIQLCGLGKVYAKNHTIPKDAQMYAARITSDNHGRYYYSCSIEFDNIEVDSYIEPIGIDVGIRHTITTSDGEYYQLSDTSRLDRRKRKLDKRLSKYYDFYVKESIRTRTKYEDIPKSKNMQKLLDKRFKTISKIKNKVRNDIHNATKSIVDKNPSTIVIEDISVKRIARNFPFMTSYYYPQMVFCMIHDQIKYKAENRGIQIITADRNYPSSQICSCCGNIEKTDRNTYKCPSCGLILDRDYNAAINLRNLAYQL